MYYENMVGSSSSNFANIVIIGERIENGLKIGKITSVDNQTVVKKSQGFAKKKEVEASVMIENVYLQVQAHVVHMLYYPCPYIYAAQYQQPAYQHQYQQPPQALVFRISDLRKIAETIAKVRVDVMIESVLSVTRP